MNSPFNINTINSTGGNRVLGSRDASFGENQFLELLTEQLRNQTPFEPVDSESFNTQLASFSNMEEQREMNANLLQLLDYQGVLARAQGLSQGSVLLGKNVEYVTDEGDTGAAEVTSVFVAETGDVRLRLSDGEEIDLRQVLGITQSAGGGGGSGSSTGGGASTGSSAAPAGGAGGTGSTASNTSAGA